VPHVWTDDPDVPIRVGDAARHMCGAQGVVLPCARLSALPSTHQEGGREWGKGA